MLIFQGTSTTPPSDCHQATVGSTRFSGFSDLAFREGQVEELHDAAALVIYLLGNDSCHRKSSKEKIFMVIFHPNIQIPNKCNQIISNLSGRFSLKKENKRITGRRSTAGHLRLLRSVGSARGRGCLLVLEAEFVRPAFRAFRLF